MPLANHQEFIAAPPETVWAMMREKIERPDKYVPGVVQVEIVNRFDDGSVERIMVARTEAGEKTIHEMIAASDATRTVVFLLKDDPDFYGFISNTVSTGSAEGAKTALTETAEYGSTISPPCPKCSFA